MARKSGGLWTGETTVARSASGGVIAADSATLTDANIPPAQALDCAGYDTVLVGVEVTVPGTSTMTVEALFYDPDAADGSRWSRHLLGAPPGVTAVAAPAAETTGALPGTGASYAELRVNGHSKVFLRVTAVANSGATTGYKILARPGAVRGDRAINKKAA